MGQRARYERYVADLLYVLASGQHIDEVRTERFSKQIEEIHRNPFEKRESVSTAEQIKNHVLELLLR